MFLSLPRWPRATAVSEAAVEHGRQEEWAWNRAGRPPWAPLQACLRPPLASPAGVTRCGQTRCPRDGAQGRPGLTASLPRSAAWVKRSLTAARSPRALLALCRQNLGDVPRPGAARVPANPARTNPGPAASSSLPAPAPASACPPKQYKIFLPQSP